MTKLLLLVYCMLIISIANSNATSSPIHSTKLTELEEDFLYPDYYDPAWNGPFPKYEEYLERWLETHAPEYELTKDELKQRMKSIYEFTPLMDFAKEYTHGECAILEYAVEQSSITAFIADDYRTSKEYMRYQTALRRLAYCVCNVQAQR